ncbi:MAG: hypothetical protein IIB55_05055 [Planctomycetes bacterium]|nr:hypothetical protein [Planctomycetota bacterium]
MTAALAPNILDCIRVHMRLHVGCCHQSEYLGRRVLGRTVASNRDAACARRGDAQATTVEVASERSPMLKVVTSTIAALALTAAAAAQQGGWLIESSNVVSPSKPTTTVEVWAWFDDPTGERNAFGRGDFDFIAADGEFSNPQMYLWTSPGFSAGTPMGNSVRGVFVGQLWGFVGLSANMQNPILVWSVDWTTTDFTPRTVSLDTRNTTTFEIGTNGGHALTMNLLELYPQGFTPGTGVIRVVPSPASATLLVLGAVMLRRRRRDA